MPLLHLFVLALVQGLTEFLPISSSGHLVLTWQALGSEAAAGDQLVIDIAVHLGTLLAVCGYFWRDLGTMAGGLWAGACGRPNAGTRLLGYLALATVPLALAGFALQARVDSFLRDPLVIAWTTIVFGIVLYLADRVGLKLRRIEHMRGSDALVVGFLQILALIPGTSRSGITMTAGRLLGYERPEAARFSMLLAIPAILGAGAFAGLELYRSGDAALGLDALLAGAMAFLAALLAIAVLMRWLRRAGFTPFVVYRLGLGAVLLWLIHAGHLEAFAL